MTQSRRDDAGVCVEDEEDEEGADDDMYMGWLWRRGDVRRKSGEIRNGDGMTAAGFIVGGGHESTVYSDGPSSIEMSNRNAETLVSATNV